MMSLNLFSPGQSVSLYNATATTEIYTLSLHDALPISLGGVVMSGAGPSFCAGADLGWMRSEEHTSELQSQSNLVCRLLLEKKKGIELTPPGRRILGYEVGNGSVSSPDLAAVKMLYFRT